MRYEWKEVERAINTLQLEGIGERLEYDITTLLERSGLYFRIFYRVKSVPSIMRKLNKEGYGFGEHEKKLQDLIGVRIVVYYVDDTAIMQEVLDETFCREGEWSVTDNSQDEFKASKLNGVYQVPGEYLRLYTGDHKNLPIDITFELQLRTISFEGWHEIEHDMRYKTPYGRKFWKNNEDLSRTLNCVLANLELCDWSTLTVFERLAGYHYEEGNWEMMMKGRYRLRFAEQPLSDELVDFLNEHPEVAQCLYKADRAKVVFALLNDGKHDEITYDLIVKIVNDYVADYDRKTQKKLSKLCRELVQEKKKPRVENKAELAALEETATFRLNVTLMHDEKSDLEQEFIAAAHMVAGWAQTKFKNLTGDIPMAVCDYEFHKAGFDINILGNLTLGFYKMTMDQIDTKRIGVVWKTSVSLEKSDRIRMKVECDYCHTPDHLVRDSFSKPRFVDEIFKKMGYEDVEPMSLKAQRIDNMQGIEQLGQLFMNHNRTLPIVLAVEDSSPESQININRLAETVGTYAHVFVIDKKAVPMLVEASDYTEEELSGAVWVTFPGGDDKFFTKEMIAATRFDFNKYAFDSGDIYERAFRHNLVRLIKEKNCDAKEG